MAIEAEFSLNRMPRFAEPPLSALELSCESCLQARGLFSGGFFAVGPPVLLKGRESSFMLCCARVKKLSCLVWAGVKVLNADFLMEVEILRLTDDQVNRIRAVATRILGVSARVRVFGSRALDEARGGDIDLLFETDAVLPNRAEALCRLYGALSFALGERKIDILLKDGRTLNAPIFERAQRTGVVL